MDRSRAVRIPIAREAGVATSRPNAAGQHRARVEFLVFTVPLVGMYLAFLAFDLLSAASGPKSADSLAILTGAFVVVGLAGLFTTLPRAPRSVLLGDGAIEIVEWTGHHRRILLDAELSVRSLRRYGPGFFSDAPTEVVELQAGRSRPRTYLVEEGLLPLRARGPAV